MKQCFSVCSPGVPELDSDDVLERRCGDEAYVHELCSEILKVDLDSGDISKT